MSADFGPGVVVEMYRGRDDPPFVKGARFVVRRAWATDLGACADCLPGYDAPAIEIEGYIPPPGAGPLCSCCFRPVRGPLAEPRTTSAHASERATEDA